MSIFLYILVAYLWLMLGRSLCDCLSVMNGGEPPFHRKLYFYLLAPLSGFHFMFGNMFAAEYWREVCRRWRERREWAKARRGSEYLKALKEYRKIGPQRAEGDARLAMMCEILSRTFPIVDPSRLFDGAKKLGLDSDKLLVESGRGNGTVALMNISLWSDTDGSKKG